MTTSRTIDRETVLLIAAGLLSRCPAGPSPADRTTGAEGPLRTPCGRLHP